MVERLRLLIFGMVGLIFLICRIEPDSGADIDEIANIHFLESISNMLRLSREVAF